jgi:hypothetical protein
VLFDGDGRLPIFFTSTGNPLVSSSSAGFLDVSVAFYNFIPVLSFVMFANFKFANITLRKKFGNTTNDNTGIKLYKATDLHPRNQLMMKKKRGDSQSTYCIRMGRRNGLLFTGSQLSHSQRSASGRDPRWAHAHSRPTASQQLIFQGFKLHLLFACTAPPQTVKTSEQNAVYLLRSMANSLLHSKYSSCLWPRSMN